MSALSPVLATSSGAPWADPLTPLDSALTDCCLSYKQNAPVSPLESALTNASHLLDSAHFKPTCFDTLARTSPVTPLESALTKTPGMGAPQRLPAELRFRRHMRHVAPPSPVASVGCPYFLSSRGCTTPTRFRFFCVCGNPNWFVLCFHKLTNPFSRNPFLSHPYKSPGGVTLQRIPRSSNLCAGGLPQSYRGVGARPDPVGVAKKRGGGPSELHNFGAVISPFRINTCKSVSKQRTLTCFRINTCEKTGGGVDYG